MQVDGDRYRKVSGQAKRFDLSERTFRPFLKQGLKHIRLPSGTILIKDQWADEFFAKFEVVVEEAAKVDGIVHEVLKGLVR